MDGTQLAAVLSKALGKTITYQKLPMIITRLAMGRDLTKMFRWINDNDAVFVKDISAIRNEFPGMLSLEDWAKIRFTK
jgi:Holliday junction resolvasome RuvABC ATP-dependent DNA helicase subunit